MGVATGDVGVVASHLLHTMHASWPFICQKTNVYVIISTRKNSVIITEKTYYLKCINMTLKICHYNLAVFAVSSVVCRWDRCVNDLTRLYACTSYSTM